MALIPPFFLDCVVALGKPLPDGSPRWSASGFLYGQFNKRVDETNNLYRVYLVTNRHVLEGAPSIIMRFNPEGAEPARQFAGTLLNQDGSPKWTAHPDATIDVAVLPIIWARLLEEGIRASFFTSDKSAADRDWLRDKGVTEGDGLFALGFPMGLVGGDRNVVLVRQGIIARIRDCLDGQAKEFLIDASVFPGNSGGPVVLRPELTFITGTSHPTEARLIGVATSYVPYTDVAVSQATGQTRVIFQENSGLAAVHPVDHIRETIAVHLATLPPESGPAESGPDDSGGLAQGGPTGPSSSQDGATPVTPTE